MLCYWYISCICNQFGLVILDIIIFVSIKIVGIIVIIYIAKAAGSPCVIQPVKVGSIYVGKKKKKCQGGLAV